MAGGKHLGPHYFGPHYFGPHYFSGGSELFVECASTRGAATSSATCTITPAVSTPRVATGGPRVAPSGPKQRRRARQTVYTWPEREDLKPVSITATAKSVGAPRKADGRLVWLKVIKGRSASAAAARGSQVTCEVIDIELQEFMELALRLAA